MLHPTLPVYCGVRQLPLEVAICGVDPVSGGRRFDECLTLVRPHQHRRVPALMAVGIALMLTATAVLISSANSRVLAPTPTSHRTGAPIVVPHPSPGPFGS
jgi:hypothetical protein